MSPASMVEECLDQMGPLIVSDRTMSELVEQAESDGPLSWDTDQGYETSSRRIADTLALIAGTREFQFG